MYSLLLFERPTRSEAFCSDLTRIARNWRRSTRALGGYWAGSFELSAEDMGRGGLTDFYERSLGNIVREYAAGGLLGWEGYILEMRLVLGGVEYFTTLLPDWWHNYVQVVYTHPDAEDSEQGNLAYDVAPGDSFQDDAQDFSDWETLAGDGVYRIAVTNTDGSVGTAHLGAAFTTDNADDSIACWEDLELTEDGWTGTHLTKTPTSYKVYNRLLAGRRTDTGWSENTDSSGEYGRMEYIATLGSATVHSATLLRNRHLTEFAWPRSRMVGGISVPGAQASAQDRLLVLVGGFWHTLNWRYRSTSRLGSCSSLITTLVGESEFVTAGRIETNALAVTVDCEPNPQRLGDLIESVINFGDEGDDVWQGGVYGGRELRYEEAPTTVKYYLQSGRLVDAGGVAVLPPLLEPGFLLRNSDAPMTWQPPGTSSVWDDPQVAYVDEVEFIAPDKLKLRLWGEEESIIVLQEQIKSGVWMPPKH